MVYLDRGTAYNKLKKYNNALQDYTKAIELDNSSAEVFSNRGDVYYILQDYDNAIEDYNKAIELDNSYAKAYFNLATIYQNTDFDKAEKYFNKTIDNIENFNDKKYLPYQGLAYIYQRKGEEKRTEEYLQKAKELGYEPEEE